MTLEACTCNVQVVTNATDSSYQKLPVDVLPESCKETTDPGGPMSNALRDLVTPDLPEVVKNLKLIQVL